MHPSVHGKCFWPLNGVAGQIKFAQRIKTRSMQVNAGQLSCPNPICSSPIALML